LVDSLDLEAEPRNDLLRNPQQYLSTLSDVDAEHIGAALAPAYRRSFKIIFQLGAGIAAFAFFVAVFLMPHIDLARPDDAKLKEEGRQPRVKEKSEASA
jgi:hypothetical protein